MQLIFQPVIHITITHPGLGRKASLAWSESSTVTINYTRSTLLNLSHWTVTGASNVLAKVKE